MVPQNAAPTKPLHFHTSGDVINKKLWIVSAAMGPVVLISPMIGGKQAGPVFLFALGLWLFCLALMWG